MSEDSATTALWFLRIFELLKKDHEIVSEASRRVVALAQAVTENDLTAAKKYERYYAQLTQQRSKADSEVSAQLDEVVRRLKDAAGKTDS